MTVNRIEESQKMKINEVFTNWMTGGGIMKALDSTAVSWANQNIGQSLDLQYHGNHSGQKTVAPLISTLAGGMALDNSKIANIATMLYNIYGIQWNKRYATLSLAYIPLDNYCMTESENGTNDATQTGTNTNVVTYGKSQSTTDENVTTYGKTDTESKSQTGTNEVNTTITATTEQNNDVFGFNSTTESNADKQTGTGTNTTVTTNPTTNTETNTNTGSGHDDIANTHSETYSGHDDTAETLSNRNQGRTSRTLTRQGNIGVTTSQQMLEAERNVTIYNFFETVFTDIDKILALKIYE